jgi:hypothetical protein
MNQILETPNLTRDCQITNSTALHKGIPVQ